LYGNFVYGKIFWGMEILMINKLKFFNFNLLCGCLHRIRRPYRRPAFCEFRCSLWMFNKLLGYFNLLL